MHNTGSIALSIWRILVGAYFLIMGTVKLASGWLGSGAALNDSLMRMLPQSVPAYADFLQSIVLPNIAVFSALVTVGEIATGLSLGLGVVPRAGALVGAWLTLNYMLMRGGPVLGLEELLFCMSCLGFAMWTEHLRWRLDHLRAGRLRRAPLRAG